MKRQNKAKPSNNKPTSHKAASRTVELSQKTADVKPGMAKQLGSGERNTQEDGHLLARLSQAGADQGKQEEQYEIGNQTAQEDQVGPEAKGGG